MSRAGNWYLMHVAPKVDKAVIPRTKSSRPGAGWAPEVKQP